ncbi:MULTISPECIES: vitamin K epoxide reductase family protein [Flavobacterium]|uniref:vitamin K epoxide reductase family protein n=1 Tax=Flavobacterium TaxID=237 RepID=UPI001FCCA51C|nr:MULTISPECIES: vitamin K epoxide reductase family protein [Flavobacterium]UOK43460.1 thioredoxin domain-containing protein [Flavobacterium enshiense]
MTDLIEKYLTINHYSEQKKDFLDLYASHPNYPSVFAITDTLDSLSIPNVAIKIPKEQFIELPDSFLTIFKQSMVLVLKSDISVTIEFEDGKGRNLSFNEFLTDWGQVVIAIEPNEVMNDASKSLNIKRLRYVAPVIVLVAFSLIYNEYSTTSLILLLTSLLGLGTAVLILQEKFGYANGMVSKICTINSNTSCNSLIQSDSDKKWIQFSDLPFLFFGISVMSIIIQPQDAALIVGIISILSLPVILYSIWLQKVQLRKWCVLCLMVSFIVITQSLFFGIGTQMSFSFSSIQLFDFLFSVFFFASIWMVVKPIFEAKIAAEKEIVRLIKFKRNHKLFMHLTKEIPNSLGFDQLKGLSFGNKQADIQLTIIISPSCVHCHKVFEDAYKLMTKFPERVFLKVLFNINPENDENPYRTVVENLLVIGNSFPEKALAAITDWHIEKMELDEWKAKWADNVIGIKTREQIQQQYNWCRENGFNYTPVKVINDKLFPDGYEIDELRYFLNEFSEESVSLGTAF